MTYPRIKKAHMRSNILRRAAFGSFLLVALTGLSAPAHAAAQEVTGTPADTNDNDDGFNEGLLGLAGLAGLLGLRRREQKYVDRSDVNRPAASRV